MYCKNLLKRSRNLKTVFYCRKKTKYISGLDICKNCSDFDLKRNKPIKKVNRNKKTVSKETYQKVYKRDKGICQLCGSNQNLHLHHILGRSKNLTDDPDNCIMLCQNCHLEVAHKNQKKYRPILLEKLGGKKC